MKNKKVLLLINSLSCGGAEKVLQTIINSNYLTNYELVCLEKNNFYKINSNIKIHYLSNSNGKENSLLKLIMLPFLSFKLYKIIKKHNIKIVQSHLFRSNYVNLITKVFIKNYSAQIFNHGIISRYLDSGIVGKINLFLIKYLYPYANKILSVSYVVQNDMQELFDFKNDLKVIYNPIDIPNINILKNQKTKKLIFNDKKKYLIFVGRLVVLKRVRDLFFILETLEVNINLIIIGEGEEKNNLIVLSEKLNIKNRVHFIGFVDNPYCYIKKADILVSCSETESFGNTIVESMVCGTAVVSSKSGGPTEIIENNKNAILVDIGDINDFIKSINKILDNDDFKNILIDNGIKHSKRFDLNNILNQYREVLEIE